MALLALAIQFASTFGHFHAEWIGGPSAATADHTGHADADHDHHHGKTPDSCSVCTTAQLAQSFTPPIAPALPVLVWSAAALHGNASDLTAYDRQRGPFQSRAPPLA